MQCHDWEFLFADEVKHVTKSKFLQADHPLYFANDSIIKNFQFIMDAENSIVIPQSLFDKLNPSLNNPFRGTKI